MTRASQERRNGRNLNRMNGANCLRGSIRASLNSLVGARTQQQTADGFRSREALTLDGYGLRRTMARDGAQAIKGALHADRCVQQYGLQMERTVRAGTRRWEGPLVGRGIELGVSYAADARVGGLRRRCRTLSERKPRGKLGARTRRRGFSSASLGTGRCFPSSRGGSGAVRCPRSCPPRTAFGASSRPS